MNAARAERGHSGPKHTGGQWVEAARAERGHSGPKAAASGWI